MALNINPPNFSGLSGGGASGNLNLTVPGALGLQALQLNRADEASRRNAAIEQARLRQQGEAALRNQAIQRQQLQQQGLLAQQQLAQQDRQSALEALLKKEQLTQQGTQFNQTLDQGNRELEVKEKQRLLEAQKLEMAKLLEEKKETIHEKGVFASHALMAIKQAKSPEEAQQLRTEILKEAVSKGHVTSEEAKSASQMPLSQFQNALGYKIMQYGAVKEFKSMFDATEEKESKSAGSLTAPIKTQAQKDIIFAGDNINELKSVFKSVPDEFFGAAAAGQSATLAREWAENIPGIGKIIGPDTEAKDSLKIYSALQGQIKNMSMTIIKQLSGVQYSDKQLEFLKEVVPSIGPGTTRSVFEGRSQNLMRFFEQIQQERLKLLENKGISEESPEYKEELLSRMKTAVNTEKKTAELFEQARKDPRYKDWSDEKLRRGIDMMNKGAKDE